PFLASPKKLEIFLEHHNNSTDSISSLSLSLASTQAFTIWMSWISKSRQLNRVPVHETRSNAQKPGSTLPPAGDCRTQRGLPADRIWGGGWGCAFRSDFSAAVAGAGELG